MKKTECGRKLWMLAQKRPYKKLNKRFKKKIIRSKRSWMASTRFTFWNKKQRVSDNNCWIRINNTRYLNSTYCKISNILTLNSKISLESRSNCLSKRTLKYATRKQFGSSKTQSSSRNKSVPLSNPSFKRKRCRSTQKPKRPDSSKSA